VFSVVGNISFEKALKIIESPLREIPCKRTLYVRSGFHDYKPKFKTVQRDVTQSLCAMGRPAYSLHDSNRFKLYLLNNILGGPSMNSRLNLSLRENYGYVYSIESSYQPFSDTGFFGIYFGTEEKTLKKCQAIVQREMEKLRSKKLGSNQLHSAKEQAIGQMAMAEENYAALMLVYGKSLIDHSKIDSLDRIFEQIRATTAEELLEIAQDIFHPDQLSYLIYTPN
jgi:predicted Zn-dependent peptidase